MQAFDWSVFCDGGGRADDGGCVGFCLGGTTW
jgi:hypothetical protein